MSSRGEVDRSKLDDLRKFLEEKIEELRREMEFYELILSLIEGRYATARPRPEMESLVVRDSSGSVIATLSYSKNKLRINPNISIRMSNHVFNTFLLRFLEEKKSRSRTISNYEIQTDRSGYVTEISIEGNIDEVLLTELQAAMRFIADKLRERER